MKESFNDDITDNDLKVRRVYLTNSFLELMKMLLEVRKEYKILYDVDIKIIADNNKLLKISKTNF